MSAKYKFQYRPAAVVDKWPYSIVYSDNTLDDSLVKYSSRRSARRAAIVNNLRLLQNQKRFMGAGEWVKMSEYITVP